MIKSEQVPQPKPLDLPLTRVLATWWPLAASWLLMGIELPILSAVVARLPNPEINLAAFGGVVYPISLIIEAPIIMLLAASTALSKDWQAYRLIYRFMMVTSFALTILHALIAFTPLYYWVIGQVIGAPREILEPARVGLAIMLPWTWAIAYRRFHQGVLIRFGYSKAVMVGTFVRLSVNTVILLTGFYLSKFPGITVASSAMAIGVTAEAIYIGLVVRPVMKSHLLPPPEKGGGLSIRPFLAFYIPLVMTSLLTQLAGPLVSAAISRMPRAIDSLAVWPVVMGAIFVFRSLGLAYNEVVVAMLDTPGSSKSLFRFALFLSLSTTFGLFLLTATPLSSLWFEKISGLSLKLAEMARTGIWFALPLPALSVMQSWYQGVILYGKRTQGITEAVMIYVTTSAIILGIGVWLASVPGFYIGLLSVTFSTVVQTIWLRIRNKPVSIQLQNRDSLLSSH